VIILCIGCSNLLKEYTDVTCLRGINVDEQLEQV
jgi:hypothetical protein